MRIAISCWGGLAGQLSGLATAIWVQDYLQRPVTIHFHNGGISRRDWEISDLATGFRVRTIRENAEIYGNSEKARLDERLLAKAILKAHQLGDPLRITCVGARIDAGLVQRVEPWTLSVWGYPTDWSRILGALPDLSDRITRSGRPNFFVGAGQGNYIAVHWRLGDYVQSRSANAFHGTISARSILDAISLLPETDLPVRLFTDSPDIALKQMSREGSLSGIDIVQQSIWQDLVDMTRGKYFIGSHSGVSLWAALARKHSGCDQVLLPDRWFRTETLKEFDPNQSLTYDEYPVEFD